LFIKSFHDFPIEIPFFATFPDQVKFPDSSQFSLSRKNTELQDAHNHDDRPAAAAAAAAASYHTALYQ